MGRKNRRNREEYGNRPCFNQNKYINSGYLPYERYARPYRTPHRGEVWFAELGCHGNTSVQEGCRPVIIVSNDGCNHHSDTICVLPMTSKLKKSYLPSHVEIGQDDLQRRNTGRIFEPSMALAEQITTISKTSLRSYLGIVEAGEKMREINNAVRVQLMV